MKSPYARRGDFKVARLLAVIAILGILIALLIPAREASRESARRTALVNNLKQIGTAGPRVDEAKRRWGRELKPDDRVLCWTRGYSDGGVIPIRLFLAPYRVISDSYGVFVYDPDAGYARGFEPGFTLQFHGWRNGLMVMKDTRDGALYSCLSGLALDGPRKGERLKPLPTLTSTWGEWLGQYPRTVAYHVTDKYKPVELPLAASSEWVKTRPAETDPRLAPDDLVLGVRVADTTRAYQLRNWKKPYEYVLDELGGEEIVVMWKRAPNTAAAYRLIAHQPLHFKAPQPDADDVISPDRGEPLPPSSPALPPQAVEVEIRGLKGGSALVTKGGTNGDDWDIAGRCQAGKFQGWTLEPVDAVVCKWFAWAAEYPETSIYGW